MNTIQLTDEQYNALMQGQSITIEPPKPEKWEPKGGEWLVSSYGDVYFCDSNDRTRLFGLEYSTRNSAEKARDAMLDHNLLLAWIAENDDGWVADWNNPECLKGHIYYNHVSKQWVADANTSFERLSTVYMSPANAEKLAKLLNDGVVEL